MEICKCAFDVLAYLAIIQSFDLKKCGPSLHYLHGHVSPPVLYAQAEVRFVTTGRAGCSVKFLPVV